MIALTNLQRVRFTVNSAKVYARLPRRSMMRERLTNGQTYEWPLFLIDDTYWVLPTEDGHGFPVFEHTSGSSLQSLWDDMYIEDVIGVTDSMETALFDA